MTTGAKPKTKQDKKPEDRILIAELLGAYEECNGDIDLAHKLVKKKVGKRDFRRIAKDYFFDLRLSRNQEEVLEAVMADAKQRKIEQLNMLRNIRIRAYNAIMGRLNPQKTGYLDKPLPARSMERAMESLCKVLELEMEVYGDRHQRGHDAENLFLFASQAILGGGTAAPDRGSPFDVTEPGQTEQ